jgi:hypothetical protein
MLNWTVFVSFAGVEADFAYSWTCCGLREERDAGQTLSGKNSWTALQKRLLLCFAHRKGGNYEPVR